MTRTILAIILFFLCASIYAQEIIFEPNDSIRIESMLREGIKQDNSVCLSLYYGKQFLNTPYVGGTLDVYYAKNPQTATEQLIINLDELDCTTFVEVVCALVKTTTEHKTTFKDFCDNLMLFRFKNGKIEDYTSRNHYHSTWIDNAEALQLAREIGPKDGKVFTAHRKQIINYMTTHPTSYAALKTSRGPEYLKTISQDEKAITREVYFIPTSALDKSKSELSCVQDGDILSLVTTKAGLDVSHLGIAIWGKDGKLHLLNASSIHHKVVIEPRTLKQYQQAQKTQLGIRVVRLTQNNNQN